MTNVQIKDVFMILGKIHTESTLDAAVKTIGEYLTHNDL